MIVLGGIGWSLPKLTMTQTPTTKAEVQRTLRIPGPPVSMEERRPDLYDGAGAGAGGGGVGKKLLIGAGILGAGFLAFKLLRRKAAA